MSAAAAAATSAATAAAIAETQQACTQVLQASARACLASCGAHCALAWLTRSSLLLKYTCSTCLTHFDSASESACSQICASMQWVGWGRGMLAAFAGIHIGVSAWLDAAAHAGNSQTRLDYSWAAAGNGALSQAALYPPLTAAGVTAGPLLRTRDRTLGAMLPWLWRERPPCCGLRDAYNLTSIQI